MGQGRCFLQEKVRPRQSPVAWSGRRSPYLPPPLARKVAEPRDWPHTPALSQNWSHWENSTLEKAGG